MPLRAVRSVLSFALLALAALSVHAEAPMNTDDAGTLDKGGMKVEAVWSKDDRTKGGELLFGFSPIEHLELELGATQGDDDAASPATRTRAAGFGAKWVPYQNETGWSLGGRIDIGQARIDDRAAGEKFTERAYAVTGLASWRRENGQVLHVNLGAAQVEVQGNRDTVGTWSVGYEFPLVEKLQLTAETFGAEHSRPDKAIGLRYEVFDGLKVSAAAGRGNDRSFGQAGVAWEF